MIQLDGITYCVGDKAICKDITYAIKPKSLTGIVGPNGSGKTTLLKQIYRVYQPTSGAIYIDGKELSSYSYKESARQIAVMAQESYSDITYDVSEVVLMGRAPHHDLFGRQTKEDIVIMEDSLKQVSMFERIDQSYFTLSGGEKQRVLLARALAQQTNILVLDEPSNHLDIGHQYKLFEFLSHLDKTIFTSVHDLNLALRFCDEIIVLNFGEIVSFGKPEEVLTEKLLSDVFSVDCKLHKNEKSLTRFIEYVSSN